MSRAPSDQPESVINLPSRAMAGVLLSGDLLEALPDAIVAVDRDGTIIQVNSQAQELFGYHREELIGKKVEMLVPVSYRSQHKQHRQNFAEAPKMRRMGADLDLYGRRRNGSEFPVEISLSPVSTDDGMYVLSAIRDISDRKRIAEELRRANEELHRRTAEQLGEYRSRLALIIDSSEDAIYGKTSRASSPVGTREPSTFMATRQRRSSESRSRFLPRLIARMKFPKFCEKLPAAKPSALMNRCA